MLCLEHPSLILLLLLLSSWKLPPSRLLRLPPLGPSLLECLCSWLDHIDCRALILSSFSSACFPKDSGDETVSQEILWWGRMEGASKGTLEFPSILLPRPNRLCILTKSLMFIMFLFPVLQNGVGGSFSVNSWPVNSVRVLLPHFLMSAGISSASMDSSFPHLAWGFGYHLFNSWAPTGYPGFHWQSLALRSWRLEFPVGADSARFSAGQGNSLPAEAEAVGFSASAPLLGRWVRKGIWFNTVMYQVFACVLLLRPYSSYHFTGYCFPIFQGRKWGRELT